MMHRCGHRGLTLMEVLASLVITAMLAGVCVRMLRSAVTVIGEARPADDSGTRLDLEALADAIIKEPASFGLASWEELTSAEVDWPEQEHPGMVTLTKLACAGCEDHQGSVHHDWFVLRYGSHLVVRFVARPLQPDSKEHLP